MEENNAIDRKSDYSAQEEQSFINFQAIYKTIVLNWYWFILSLIICIGLAKVFLRYATPTYQITAKLLVKDADNNRSSSIKYTSNLGTISNSNGLDNEMEILTSRSLATAAVRRLKLYTTYTIEGRIKELSFYKNQPITVDVDSAHLEKLNAPISLTIKRIGNYYEVTGSYYVPIDENAYKGPYTITKKVASLPTTIATQAGNITLTANNNGQGLRDGQFEMVIVNSPKSAAAQYTRVLQVAQDAKASSIAQLQITDAIPQRSIDYLKQLIFEYNLQANEDKNAIALRTEKFINERLGKINAELGKTEGELQQYKQENGMIALEASSAKSFENQNASEEKLVDLQTQIELFNTISSEIEKSSRNLTQVIPSNVGLQDESSTKLIDRYNELVLERNRLLRSASESSPVVQPLTDQIRSLNRNIKDAINAAKRSLLIQRDALASQYNKYSDAVAEAPKQEKDLTQIGRQQEVKSGLYLMLLQKREENNISLAATADKGKLLDDPELVGQVSPQASMILASAALIGLLIPALVLFLISLLRYKIEGHEDVTKLTRLPILADVAVASNKAKGKANIVVHENQNNQMEEIFRSMRTNLQFMLQEGEKVILFTSSTSGEGKTFIASNLAMSFALLGKKVILVGLDIRRPRLAELFNINDHKHGITNLLVKHDPTREDIEAQILPSGVHGNLELLMSGPVPPNPAELTARQSLDDIFNILKEKYDYIIIDTAPVGLVTDTLQIARVANATVYLCRADYTPKSTFGMINEFAENKKLPKISLVLNGIDFSKKKYGYEYGYGKYGRYGKYGSKQYSSYGNYGSYGNYSNSHYSNKNDDSIKK
ncbi:GumC family protein [Prevotella bivia]|uniref:non-specific protein-tyrosine kinase n=1 Tax=Prevotella bivia DSM 20514 TaxID=868129 RepID=I4Z6Y6_9BACT|nr:polysaccharide biosynthesis tyrosine autokinase [Prevotella bivia]EFB93602.1 chain length determinant protein [Prevotella bivia JCVIHMP010]EIM31978.1 capsular exopolysaccharide biosynthesis protein [Prevotella bivia DSM 20514]